MTSQGGFHKLCTNINNKQYQEMSKQNIPYMRLLCQSNIFSFFYQSNSDVSSVDIEVIRQVFNFIFIL